MKKAGAVLPITRFRNGGLPKKNSKVSSAEPQFNNVRPPERTGLTIIFVKNLPVFLLN